MAEKSEKIIPCDGCNMLAADLGFTYDDLTEAGAIVDGEMVRHFTDCPFGEDAYPRVTGRQVLAGWAKVSASWNAFWKSFGL